MLTPEADAGVVRITSLGPRHASNRKEVAHRGRVARSRFGARLLGPQTLLPDAEAAKNSDARTGHTAMPNEEVIDAAHDASNAPSAGNDSQAAAACNEVVVMHGGKFANLLCLWPEGWRHLILRPATLPLPGTLDVLYRQLVDDVASKLSSAAPHFVPLCDGGGAMKESDADVVGHAQEIYRRVRAAIQAEMGDCSTEDTNAYWASVEQACAQFPCAVPLQQDMLTHSPCNRHHSGRAARTVALDDNVDDDDDRGRCTLRDDVAKVAADLQSSCLMPLVARVVAAATDGGAVSPCDDAAANVLQVRVWAHACISDMYESVVEKGEKCARAHVLEVGSAVDEACAMLQRQMTVLTSFLLWLREACTLLCWIVLLLTLQYE